MLSWLAEVLYFQVVLIIGITSLLKMLIFGLHKKQAATLVSTDIQQQISELIEEELSQLALPVQPESLYEPVRYTLAMDGKRIRPYFTLSACGLCNGNIEEARPAATAIELLHNFTLLHDDIMDSAATRRGQASVYKKWNNSIAILSGDAMYAWAFEQLQYYGENEQYSKKQYCSVLDIFLESAKAVCEGQAYDLDFEEKRATNLDAYNQMIHGKTAALIIGAFKIGGKVANASEEEMKLLGSIGEQIGIGFQIQDDLLDVAADPNQFGKRTGGDIFENKKTYLSILALDRSNPQQKKKLLEIFDKSNASDTEIQVVIDIYRSLGIIESTQKAIDFHYDQSIQSIKTFKNSTYKTDLIEFLINLKNRKY